MAIIYMIFLKGYMSMAWGMAMEDIFGRMEATMRENGRIILWMEMEKKWINLEIIMKESFYKINLNDKANILSKKVVISKDNGKVVN